MGNVSLNLAEFSVKLLTSDPVKHDFSNIHPIVLSSRGVTPVNWEWKAERFRSYTSFNVISYENDIELYGDSSSLRIEKTKGLDFKKGYEFVHTARRYIESLMPDTFSKAALNWEIHVPYENPDVLSVEKFYNHDAIPETWENVETVPLFRFDSEGLHTTLVLYTAPNKDFIVADVSASIQGPTDEGTLNKWLSDYLAHETTVLKNLDMLLRIENGTD